MVALPVWFSQLKWSNAVSIAALNLDRSIIPVFPGCYAFTRDTSPLRPRQVLYIGEAKVSLANRLPVYLLDFSKPKTAETHKGKGFILSERASRGDYGVFVRWVEYGGAGPDISLLESSLIDFLDPWYNDRDEYVRHGGLGAWESLDPRLLR